MENISKIFNSSDIAELKSAFKEILIEKFRYEVEQYDTWFFDKDEMDELCKECYKEILDEVKGEIKEYVKADMIKVLDKKKKGAK